MAQTVADVMTADPMTIEADVEISAAAQQMRDNDVGSIVVQDHGQLLGVVTDRDIVVRLVAAQRELTPRSGRSAPAARYTRSPRRHRCGTRYSSCAPRPSAG